MSHSGYFEYFSVSKCREAGSVRDRDELGREKGKNGQEKKKHLQSSGSVVKQQLLRSKCCL
uniref:Uncharacterized protein n=1 Tax=Pristionchus pacificus TaxID=54126 RepID=A0A2A6C6J6_PRIPA|eukprot:PDM73832.1 hypothetical protein PRIPAC_41188 [Pristionchus pacificus]